MISIFAYLAKYTLGDFASDALFSCAVRELFEDAELSVHFIDNRPYKADIACCIWNAKTVTGHSPGGTLLPFDALEPQMRGLLGLDPALSNTGALDADLVLAGHVFQPKAMNTMTLPVLRCPEDRIESSNQALIELGLDPSRWIATVYWKEPGYRYRGSMPIREISNPAPYIAAIRHIIDSQGGQVVRLGHSTETAMPEIPGLIDLAKAENSHWLQLYAVSLSRFMLTSPSGPSAYGGAFGVPTALTNHIEVSGAWRAHDYIVTRAFMRDSHEYRQLEAYEAGALGGPKTWSTNPRPFSSRMNTAEELIAAADEMFHSTRTCIGWRAPAHSPPSPRANGFTIPQRSRVPFELLIPPSQRITPPV